MAKVSYLRIGNISPGPAREIEKPREKLQPEGKRVAVAPALALAECCKKIVSLRPRVSDVGMTANPLLPRTVKTTGECSLITSRLITLHLPAERPSPCAETIPGPSRSIYHASSGREKDLSLLITRVNQGAVFEMGVQIEMKNKA